METKRIYTFIGFQLLSTPDTEVVSLELVKLSDEASAVKFAEEIAEFGAKHVMLHAATPDNILKVFESCGIKTYQYDMVTQSFSPIFPEL